MDDGDNERISYDHDYVGIDPVVEEKVMGIKTIYSEDDITGGELIFSDRLL